MGMATAGPAVIEIARRDHPKLDWRSSTGTVALAVIGRGTEVRGLREGSEYSAGWIMRRGIR